MELLKPVYTKKISTSTGLLLEHLKSRPFEPKDGRFSHLLGRHVAWTSANDGALHLPVEKSDYVSLAREEELRAIAAQIARRGSTASATAQ